MWPREWIYYLKNNRLPERFTAPGLEKAEIILNYHNMDPEARALYEAHQKEMAVSFGVLETAKLEGKLEGKAEGKLEGKAEGRQEGLEIGLERKTTEVVVNASGMWGREIGKMVGLSLPVLPMAHLYIMTKPIEGVTNTFPNLRDPDLLVYWREEVGGLVTGGYERQPATFGMKGIPKDFKFQLLPPDWDRFLRAWTCRRRRHWQGHGRMDRGWESRVGYVAS